MLEKYRIAADRRVEDADVGDAFDGNKKIVIAITGVPRIITRLTA